MLKPRLALMSNTSGSLAIYDKKTQKLPIEIQLMQKSHVCQRKMHLRLNVFLTFLLLVFKKSISPKQKFLFKDLV